MRTGVTIVDGLMGHGKSYFCVRRAIEYARSGRPVYTNLPIKWRCLRWWLDRKYGAGELSGLIRPLKRAHFVQFLERFANFHRFMEAGEFRAASREPMRRFEAEHGPNIIEGKDANWVPRGSVVMVDEVHLWIANKNICGKVAKEMAEPSELLSYLTMHRHLMHRVYVVSQRERQVTPTVKSLAEDNVWCIDRARVPIAYGISLKTFGIPSCFSTVTMQAEQETPIARSTLFPWLPWNSIYFRLYRPYVHAGGASVIADDLQSARGDRVQSFDRKFKADRKEKMKFLFKLTALVALTVTVSAWLVRKELTTVLGARIDHGMERISDRLGERVTAGVVSSGQKRMLPAVVGLSGDWVSFACGNEVRCGNQYEGVTICRDGDRIYGIDDRDNVWVWLEDGRPGIRVGTVDTVVQRVEQQFAARSDDDATPGQTLIE